MIRKKLIDAISIVVLCIALLLLAGYLIRSAIRNEAQKAKTEMVEKVKTIKIDDTSAAKSVAKSIHKFRTFKAKVKSELKSLDSADTAK
jgi:uncharacterized membrane protein YraQ (UPF0718 family)